ncbi:MAG: zf-HC2 domain-containing protein [Candidatus Eremiobacteraeota bacterium]|nr:zf-HC2 domain-containing protein [Candidatus Eremiobacteraeota bacterium]
MRCSYFERLLDAYVDGELSPVQRARVANHVAGCPHCDSLLQELRVIDALLLTPRQVEPAPNFTFKLMAEVRCLPQPHAHRNISWAMLATYIVFGWVAIGAFLAFGGASARAAFGSIALFFARTGASFGAVAVATGHLFGRQTFDVTAAMGGIIAVDLVIASGVVAFYALLRGRRSTATLE